MATAIERKAPLPAGHAEIWLGGGCFWGCEKYLGGIPGVASTSVGYANCRVPSPTYEQVCGHGTGCAEAVHVVYDPIRLPLAVLLEKFFRAIDPTSINRQGEDVGEQYRTGVYYLGNEDVPIIEAAMARLAKGLHKPLAVEAKPLASYYLAEEYHQAYLHKNPAGYCHISDAMCEAAREGGA